MLIPQFTLRKLLVAMAIVSALGYAVNQAAQGSHVAMALVFALLSLAPLLLIHAIANFLLSMYARLLLNRRSLAPIEAPALSPSRATVSADDPSQQQSNAVSDASSGLERP